MADLFLRLYSELDELAARHEADEWGEDATILDIAADVEERAILDGELDPEQVAEQLELADTEIHGRRYAYLLGIDRALAAVHPALDAPDRAGLTQAAARFRRYGRLNSRDEDGALLPRYAIPQRRRVMLDEAPIEGKDDLFENVTVVEPEQWSRTDSTRIPRIADFLATARTEGLLVGAAPVARGGDVEIGAWAGRHRRYYAVEPREGPIAPRIPMVLARLDERGADVGLMPELTLTPTLVEAWREALRSRPPPLGSRLRLIMLGTGPLERRGDGLVANRAVVLRRDGTEVLTQDKRHGFLMEPELIERWGMEALLGDEPCAEPLIAADRVSVGESSLGRICVLVCEDLGRTTSDREHLRALGPSHFFAPVFSKPTVAHYWEHTAARSLASEIGSQTVVVNSLVVEDLQAAAGRPETRPTGEPAHGTALAHSASADVVEVYAADPADVKLLRLAFDDVVEQAHIARDN
ncbi:MAG TPA: hypothetical protein VF529_21155 [Solirubrobacteraceae bacterium]